MSIGLAIVLSVAIAGLAITILVLQPDREAWRTSVRIVVTFAAVIFLFFGGGGLIAAFLFVGEISGAGESGGLPIGFAEARDLFTTIAPIATGIVTYWFASRVAEKHLRPNDTQTKGEEEKSEDGSTGAISPKGAPAHEEQNTLS